MFGDDRHHQIGNLMMLRRIEVLLAFLPFIAFAVLNHFVDPAIALAIAALASLLLSVREVISGKSPKILEVGTFILFAGLGVYAYFGGMSWSVIAVKLAVDIGLLMIVLASLIVGQPFTAQYAKESAPREVWDTPLFRKTNQTITIAWLVAFAILIAADLVLLYMPEVPHRVSVLLSVAALYGAFKFTTSYPQRAKRT
jgi:hypothetical protein